MANLVLVSIHARQGTNVSEYVLQCVSELERIDVAKAELYMCIDDKLGKAKDFTAQMERIAEARLLALLCSQSSVR